MLTVNRLREFVAEAVASIDAIKSGKVVVTKEEISRFMREHDRTDNTLLIGIVPEHDITGTIDNLKMENSLGFYLLDKTDYSDNDQDGFLDIFAKVQETAHELVAFIIDQNENGSSSVCGLFQYLDDVSFPITPIKGLEGCNGYFVGVSFDSAF